MFNFPIDFKPNISSYSEIFLREASEGRVEWRREREREREREGVREREIEKLVHLADT